MSVATNNNQEGRGEGDKDRVLIRKNNINFIYIYLTMVLLRLHRQIVIPNILITYDFITNKGDIIKYVGIQIGLRLLLN